MPQIIQPVSGSVKAHLTAPGAKNIAQRALLIAALADGISEIYGLPFTMDILTLVSALRQLGIVIQVDENTQLCMVAGGNGQFPKKQATIWCNHSLAIATSLVIACAGAPGVYYFDGAHTLHQRSLAFVLGILCRQGAQLIPSDSSHIPFTLVGASAFEGGDIVFDGSIKSRLISTLLMMAPFARVPFNITVLDVATQPFIYMTCQIMADFGVLVHRVHQGQYSVITPQFYRAREYTIEGDITYAAHFFCAAAITQGEVTVVGCKRQQAILPQTYFLSLLEKMGCQVIEHTHAITVIGPAVLKGIEWALPTFSDVFYNLVMLAPFAQTPTHLSHQGPITAKSRERLQMVCAQLKKLDITFEVGESWIKIHPSVPRGASIDVKDYRCLMALAVIGVRVPDIVIEHPTCVTRHYPDFFMQLNQLGAPSTVNP